MVKNKRFCSECRRMTVCMVDGRTGLLICEPCADVKELIAASESATTTLRLTKRPDRKGLNAALEAQQQKKLDPPIKFKGFIPYNNDYLCVYTCYKCGIKGNHKRDGGIMYPINERPAKDKSSLPVDGISIIYTTWDKEICKKCKNKRKPKKK